MPRYHSRISKTTQMWINSEGMVLISQKKTVGPPSNAPSEMPYCALLLLPYCWHSEENYYPRKQCFGSGSVSFGRIRIRFRQYIFIYVQVQKTGDEEPILQVRPLASYSDAP